MNNEARQKLSEIISTYGTGICENKERCKGLLLDYCSGFEAEVNVLIAVLEINAVAELLNISNPVPTDMVINRMVQRLYDVKRLDKEAARWGIESWALALGKISATLESAQLSPEETRPLTSRTPSRPRTRRARPQPPPVETLARTSSIQPPPGLPSQPLPVETRPLTSNIQPRPTLPTSIPSYGSNTQMAPPQPRANTPATSSHFLRNLFLLAFSVVILILGDRSAVFLFNQSFPLTLSAICIAAAMLGHKRGFLAVIIFFALGAIGLPVFFAGNDPIWSLSNVLIFFPGKGGMGFFSLIYYYTYPVIIFVVGAMCVKRRSGSFWRSLYIVFIGYIIFCLFILAIYIFSYHMSLSLAFHRILLFQYVALFLVFITTIIVWFINAIAA